MWFCLLRGVKNLQYIAIPCERKLKFIGNL